MRPDQQSRLCAKNIYVLADSPYQLKERRMRRRRGAVNASRGASVNNDKRNLDRNLASTADHREHSISQTEALKIIREKKEKQ